MIYYLLVIAAAMIAGVSQVLLKQSARKRYMHPIRDYLNIRVITAYILLAGSLFLNTIGFRELQLKEGAALAALSNLFVLLFSWVWLKEKMTFRKVGCNLLIVAGIIVFVLGS